MRADTLAVISTSVPQASRVNPELTSRHHDELETPTEDRHA